MAQEIEKIKRPTARPSQITRYLVIAALLAVIVVVGSGMRARRSGSVTSAPAAKDSSQSTTEPVIPVIAAVVAPSSLTESMRITGSLKTDENVVLSTKLAGKVAMLAVREGEKVRAGQLLARLDDAEQRAQRDRAAGAVRAAEAKLAQTKVGTVVKNTGAQEDYARARAATAMARQKLMQLERAARIQDTAAETRVRTAQAGLQSSNEHLKMLREGSRRQELQMAEQAVLRAQIDLENARHNSERRQQLLKDGAISQQDAEDSQKLYELAKVALDNAREQRSMTQEGPRSEEVRMAEQQVAQSEQALQDAEANRAQREMSQDEVAAARESVRQAEAAERAARAGLVQTKLSQEDIRTAAATVDQLRGDVAYYDELLRQTRIIAPVSGVVTQRLVNPGEFVSLGAKLLTMVSRDSLFLEAIASERQLPSLRTGQPARVTVDARPGRVYAGIVREVIPVAEGLSRSSRVRIAIRGGQDLPVGAFARATLPVAQHSGIVVVPNDAVLSEAGVHYVFTIVDGKARRRNIELGIREGDRVQVASGLRPGDRVITAGSPAVVDGARVSVKH
jgi:membrane fusion protein (multidrug efflux system)